MFKKDVGIKLAEFVRREYYSCSPFFLELPHVLLSDPFSAPRVHNIMLGIYSLIHHALSPECESSLLRF